MKIYLIKIISSEFKNHYADKYAIDGKIYNIPYTANAYGIYYNKDKFKELGLKVPETWEEFEELVDTIIAKGKHLLPLQEQILGP